MANSSRIIDYMGYGVAASMPATPPVGAGVIAFYYQTDTTTLKVWNGSAWVTAGGGGTQFNVPLAATFSFVNQLGATLVDNTNGPLVWSTTENLGSDQLSTVHKALPGGTQTVTANCSILTYDAPNSVYPILLDDGTKFIGINVEPTFNSGSGMSLKVDEWSSDTSYNSTPSSTLQVSLSPANIWTRVVYNSATPSLTFQYSHDGFTWFTLYTQSGSLFLTPTNAGFGADVHSGAAATPATISMNVFTL